jgi:hypothetical protein
VIQEQSCDIAEVLSVHLRLLCVELEDGDSLITVDLIARRTADCAPGCVLLKLGLAIEKIQAEWTGVQDPAMVLLR